MAKKLTAQVPELDSLRIVPLNDRIIVKRIDAETVTAGGIILSQGSQEKPRVGDVREVGEGCKIVRPGCRVLFGEYVGQGFKHRNEDLLIMKESEALAAFVPAE